jgi:hypothetical protein
VREATHHDRCLTCERVGALGPERLHETFGASTKAVDGMELLLNVPARPQLLLETMDHRLFSRDLLLDGLDLAGQSMELDLKLRAASHCGRLSSEEVVDPIIRVKEVLHLP